MKMGTAKVFPRLEQYQDFPSYVRAVREGASGVLDPEAKFSDEVAAEIDQEGTERFIERHPEWNTSYQTGANAKKLLGWCEARRIPKTLWNLSIGFGDLLADGLLEKVAPSPEAPEVDKSRGIIEARTDALAEYQPSEQETESLEKLSDDPSLGDRARKNRDDKLRLLAQQQRREYSTLSAHYNQRVVI
jgi:hypothetical protein